MPLFSKAQILVKKYLYDSYDIKFIVTGSSAYYMKNMFSESLAGRKKLFEVYPLNFSELLLFNSVPFSEIPLENSGVFLKSEYERLIGTKLDISKLTSMTGISRPTVENYLDLLEQSYLIRTIPVLSNSPDREITKAKKIYFLDNGIASVSAEAGSGAMFENAVFNQLHPRGNIAYYQLKSGKKIDFILDKKVCFEVKETATEGDLRNVKTLAQNLDIKDCHVIGRHPVKLFDGYIWGGFIH